MRQGWRLGLVGATLFLMCPTLAAPAPAVEYRLQVVSIFESTFVSFLKPAELKDGASGPGLDRLEASLDQGTLPLGGVLFDRRVQPVRESLARSYGAVPVVPRIKPGGEGSVVWDEITWAGKPGERSVWLVSPTLRHVQELRRVALKSRGPLRHFQPYSPHDGAAVPAMALPLNFLWAQEERGTAWDKYISHGLDLQEGVGVVTGVNFNATFPDQAYLIVSQAEQPTTYKAVLVWRERKTELESPGSKPRMLR